ncbi:hypothetical protein Lal_00029039 [Lupinus albus]|nr:hypothetical protein Lal_00029039 [Lupinus albus]
MLNRNLVPPATTGFTITRVAGSTITSSITTIRILQQQTDLRIKDFSILGESLLKSFAIGGPCKPTNETTEFNISRSH